MPQVLRRGKIREALGGHSHSNWVYEAEVREMSRNSKRQFRQKKSWNKIGVGGGERVNV